MQETHFICAADCRPLEGDFVVFSAAGVSLLVGRSLNANVNVLFAGDDGRLVVADITVKTFEFRLVTRDAPSIGGWGRSWMNRSS